MALFKILKGDSSNLSKQDIREGYCYVTTDEHKMYIDTNDARFALNAQSANEVYSYGENGTWAKSITTIKDGKIRIQEYGNADDGFTVANYDYGQDTIIRSGFISLASDSEQIEISDYGLEFYHSNTDDGTEDHTAYTLNQIISNDKVLIDYTDQKFYGIASMADAYSNGAVGDEATPIYINEDGVPTPCEGLSVDGFLPLTAGPDKKLTGPLGLTQDVMYGPELPNAAFDGQLFFLEDAGAGLPEGGTAGQIIMKNSNDNGDASWTNGYATTTQAGLVSTGAQTFAGAKIFSSPITVLAQDSSHEGGEIILKPATSSYNSAHIDIYDNRLRVHNGTSEWFAINLSDGTATATKLYGAVWNDYAEFRGQKEIIEPGYCVASADDGQVYRTTEKLQACDGIVSDTFGFAIGETDECKTPLAVAGRVLAYCEGDRHSYHSGDTVCAGPEGRVCKMTREEIREWPDRIIGIVSEIPEYETWGSGNISVNGRIWIKVK